MNKIISKWTTIGKDSLIPFPHKMLDGNDKQEAERTFCGIIKGELYYRERILIWSSNNKVDLLLNFLMDLGHIIEEPAGC